MPFGAGSWWWQKRPTRRWLAGRRRSQCPTRLQMPSRKLWVWRPPVLVWCMMDIEMMFDGHWYDVWCKYRTCSFKSSLMCVCVCVCVWACLWVCTDLCMFRAFMCYIKVFCTACVCQRYLVVSQLELWVYQTVHCEWSVCFLLCEWFVFHSLFVMQVIRVS